MARYPFDKLTRNRIIGRLAGRYIRFVRLSSSVTYDPADPYTLLRQQHPVILALWHGQFLLLPAFAGKDLPTANMVARHGDAEIIGEALKTFDMDLVRGGGAAGRRKDRGGVHAFREALRRLEQGTAIAMTADIPPGPGRRAGLGIVKLAAISGRPIVPVATATSRFVSLDTWSRMTVNLPFSRIGVARGDPIWVASDADADALERARKAVEAGLDETTARAYGLIGRDALSVVPHAALGVDDPPAKLTHPVRAYQLASRAITPIVPFVLGYRARRGKEDPARRSERYGVPSAARPDGELIWLHAASVGETNAVLPLIDELHRRRPACRILLTTGTITSAKLAEARLADGDLHQYAPLDSPPYVERFLKHWRPDLVALTESEIWPNSIIACASKAIPIALLNARMSDRSYRRWKSTKRSARTIFSRIKLVLAQNERLARRFRELGARAVTVAGNLKADASPLPVNEVALTVLRRQIADRPILLAASTHPGEDEILIDALRILRRSHPSLLLIIAPRHPARGGTIAGLAAAAGYTVSCRQSGDPVNTATDVYVADTTGELGLFYSLVDLAFIGGSLIAHGGQNPLEATRHSCAVLTGPSHSNFTDIYAELHRRDGIVGVTGAEDLAAAAAALIEQPDKRRALIVNAGEALAGMAGALHRTADAVEAMLAHAPGGEKPDEGLQRAS